MNTIIVFLSTEYVLWQILLSIFIVHLTSEFCNRYIDKLLYTNRYIRTALSKTEYRKQFSVGDRFCWVDEDINKTIAIMVTGIIKEPKWYKPDSIEFVIVTYDREEVMSNEQLDRVLNHTIGVDLFDDNNDDECGQLCEEYMDFFVEETYNSFDTASIKWRMVSTGV